MADLGTVATPSNVGRDSKLIGPDLPDSALTATSSDPARAAIRLQPWNQTGSGSGQPVVGASIQIG